MLSVLKLEVKLDIKLVDGSFAIDAAVPWP